MTIDLNGKTFRGTENYSDGDFDQTVRFAYEQRGAVVSARFQGQNIIHGVLLGSIVAECHLSGHWLYLNLRHEPVLGVFESRIEVSSSGRILLREKWARVTPGQPLFGVSTVEEA